MKTKLKIKNLKWRIKKYQRWCRQYLIKVRMVEREMNGAIEPC